MSQPAPLNSVFKSGSIYTVGTIVATLLQFLSGLIIVRILSQEQYGDLSLAFILVTMAAVLCTFGFNNGVPQFIAKSNANQDKKTIGAIAGAALIISTLLSVLITLMLYLEAPILAKIYDKPNLEHIGKSFALLIIPLTVTMILTAIFRGLEKTQNKVIFEDILPIFFRFLFLSIAVIFSLGFEYVVSFYVYASWISFLLYVAYSIKKIKNLNVTCERSATINLVAFSAPLLGVAFLANLVTWAGTILLGYFGDSQQVAIYNAPLKVASFVGLPLIALVFIYLPTATRLIERREFKALEKLYISATKWAVLIIYPIVCYLMLFAEDIVEILFGEHYIASANSIK